MAKFSQESFVDKVKIVLPEITVLGIYNGALNKILVKDKLGIIYNTIANSLIHGKHPNVRSAVNKSQ